MSDVLQRLKADNPVRTGAPPSFDEVWSRLQAVGSAPPQKRLGYGAIVGLIGLVPAALVVWLAVATLFRSPSPRPAGTGSRWLISYRTESVMRPARGSGASFKSTVTSSQVWISGASRHRLDTITTYLDSGGSAVGVHEMTGDGRRLETFQSGGLDQLGTLDISQDQGATQPCPLIDECAGGIAVDPSVEIRRLLLTHMLIIRRWGFLRPGRRVLELVNGPAIRDSSRYTLFVDAITLFPIVIQVQFGTEPPPRSPVEMISISDYRRVPLTSANRSLLTMRPHPGAHVTCSGPGGGGPSHPATAGHCPTSARPISGP